MIYIAKTGVRLSGTDFIKCQGNAEPVWFPLEVAKAIASFFQASTVFAMMFWLLTNPFWEKVHYGVPKREGSKKDAATGSRTAFVTRCLD